MHDAEPAARDLDVFVVRPGGLEAGSIPARISFSIARTWSVDLSPPTLRIPLELLKPRGRYAWSGGLFLRYVRPPPPNLTRVRVGTEGGGFLCVM